MADGPKVSIKIDDSVNAKIEERVALLKQARKEVRELEREAEKAIRTTGKASDEMLKRIDDAKRRAGNLNNEVRGLRSFGRPGTVRDTRPTFGSAMSDLRGLSTRGALNQFGQGMMNTRLGGGIGAAARGIGAFRGAIAGVGVAGAAFGAVAAGIYYGSERNMEAERLTDDLKLRRMTGESTKLTSMELARAKVTGSGGMKFGRSVAGAAGQAMPALGALANGLLDAGSTALRIGSGSDDYSIAKQKSAEALEAAGLTGRKADAAFRKAQTDADGNAIETLFKDFIERRPDWIKKLLLGAREEKTSAKLADNLGRKKALEADGYRLIESNNFGAAEEAFRQAAEKAGSNRATTAAEAWNERENAMQAKIRAHNMWNTVPRYRVGM